MTVARRNLGTLLLAAENLAWPKPDQTGVSGPNA